MLLPQLYSSIILPLDFGKIWLQWKFRITFLHVVFCLRLKHRYLIYCITSEKYRSKYFVISILCQFSRFPCISNIFPQKFLSVKKVGRRRKKLTKNCNIQSPSKTSKVCKRSTLEGFFPKMKKKVGNGKKVRKVLQIVSGFGYDEFFMNF